MCEQLRAYTSEKLEDLDTPIYYSRKFDEYGIKIMDGGNSYNLISFCPWCGEKLPESRRDQWFDELAQLGVTDPWNDKIPEKYLTDEWYGGSAFPNR